jgi:hypothetical protein
MDILILFGGAFLDALIGPNLIVMGEPFLLAAGYLLQVQSSAIISALVLEGIGVTPFRKNLSESSLNYGEYSLVLGFL